MVNVLLNFHANRRLLTRRSLLSLKQISCAILLAAAAAVACAKDEPDPNKRELTQREKDSILGSSQIPGAKAVNRAMKSADSANARQARLDSAEKAP
jgi:hypothetical protein